MAKILEPKVEASGLVDMAMLGVSKIVTERLAAPIVGNATLKSGAVKMVAGGLISGKGGSVGKAISGGLLVDGIEDLVGSLIGVAGGSNAVSNEVW